MSSHYLIVLLFDHPSISTSHYYVVPFHVIPLFDHPVHLSHSLPILSFISPASSCYYVVILSFIPLLFWCPIDVLLEMKGHKTFTGMKISFWTGQCVYQYSSSCSVEEEVDMPVDFPILMHFPAGHGHNHISSVHYATYVLKILYNYPTLILKECLLVLVLFSFLWIFSFNIWISPHYSRPQWLPLLMASQHPSQQANHVEGRAKHLLWGVLCTCCGSKSCFVNRAPQK